MTDKTELEVTREDRELFILLLGFDAVHSGKDLDRIHKGDFDHWEKMKAIARHRIATRTPDPTPVAWMYELSEVNVRKFYETRFPMKVPGWTETPLYAHPPAIPADGLVEALDACHAQFNFYATEHRNADKHVKAATNQKFADLCTAALAAYRGEA